MNLVPFLTSLASSTAPASTKTTSTLQRSFQYVGFGASFEQESGKERPTISCDGRIPGGVTLELTHWNGNETPDRLYADTSTEMALKLPRDEYPDAIVLNNHYDTDGVLSVFGCIQPDMAQRYSKLLIEGAEAGDFDEWSSDSGIQLNAIIEGMSDNDKPEESYQNIFNELPTILEDLSKNGGEQYKELWKPTLDHAYKSYQALKDGSASMSTKGDDDSMVILNEPFALSLYAIHRGLVEEGLLDKTTRILRVMKDKDGSGEYNYQYEKPRHGWVNKLVDRTIIPPVVNVVKLVEYLNSDDSPINKNGGVWRKGGPSGLVAICSGKHIQATPNQVANCLLELEATMK